MKYVKRACAVLITTALLFGAISGVYALFPLEYTDTIRAVAEEMDVDKYLVATLIKAESNFKHDAESRASAKGVMQLTDETATFCAEKMGLELNEGDIYDPEINIRLGVYYLNRLLVMFDGNEELAIAAYNAGEGRVKEWLHNPEYSLDGETLDTIPYEETRRHVEKIGKYKKIYKLLYPNL